jgi:heat shock protein HslJ
MPRAALVAVAGLLLAACAGAGDGALSPDALEGRTFLSTAVLERGVERPLVPGTRVRLGFADGGILIHAGCNTMGGAYAIDGDVLLLPEGLSITEIGCDPKLHEQDEWISAFLGGSPRIALEGSELSLVSGGTEIRLLDREVADPDRPLEGTAWRLESILEGEVISSAPEGVEATIRFPGDGTVEVDTGCNQGGGTVEVGEDTLRFGPLETTARGCEGPAGEVERAVLALLAGEVDYRIDGPVLSLRAGERGLDWRV